MTLIEQYEAETNLSEALNVAEEAVSVGWGMGSIGPLSGIVWRNQRPGVGETGWSTCRACVQVSQWIPWKNKQSLIHWDL